jgi:hypothetical protein
LLKNILANACTVGFCSTGFVTHDHRIGPGANPTTFEFTATTPALSRLQHIYIGEKTSKKQAKQLVAL